MNLDYSICAKCGRQVGKLLFAESTNTFNNSLRSHTSYKFDFSSVEAVGIYCWCCAGILFYFDKRNEDRRRFALAKAHFARSEKCLDRRKAKIHKTAKKLRRKVLRLHEKGFTQKKIADICGVSQPWVYSLVADYKHSQAHP